MNEQRYFLEKRPFVQHQQETQMGPTPLVSFLWSKPQVNGLFFFLPLKMLPRVEPVPTQVKTAEKAVWK